MSDLDVAAIITQLAHLEDLLRQVDDQQWRCNQSIHARLGDLEDLILGEQRAQSFTGHAKVLGQRVPLTLVRNERA